MKNPDKRKITIKYNYALVELTQGKFAKIDIEDIGRVKLSCWHYSKVGYPCSNRVTLHRMIMNPPVGMVVDHINGDKLDNRRINLRICTRTNNNQNSGCIKIKTSKYKGVCWSKGKQKWIVQINSNGKYYFVGCYKNEIDAAVAYNEKAKELHGEFARLNTLKIN